jgi:hypothetical protein
VIEQEDYRVACGAAQMERGKLLVRVYCEEHAVSLGDVRASSRGPAYRSRSRVEPNSLRRDVADRVSRQTSRARAVTFVGGYLFDHPDRPSTIATWCPIGGESEFDPGPLNDRVHEAQRSPVALKLAIPCQGS